MHSKGPDVDTSPSNARRERLLTFLKVIACQLAGAFLGHLMLPGSLDAALLAQGAIAAGLSLLFRLPRLWLLVQLVAPFAIVYGTALPAWIYLAAFALCLLVYWNTATEQVPLYLTNRKTFAAVAGLAKREGARKIADLGSGTGGVVLHLARTDTHLFATGIENAPLVFLVSRLRVGLSGLPNARILRQSLWSADLSAYDLVYCFLSPVPMPRLFEKARAEMRPGALFVSNSFPVPDLVADQVIEVADARRTLLHVYKM